MLDSAVRLKDGHAQCRVTTRETGTVRGTARRPHFSLAIISVTVNFGYTCFGVRSVYFNVRNILLKSGNSSRDTPYMCVYVYVCIYISSFSSSRRYSPVWVLASWTTSLHCSLSFIFSIHCFMFITVRSATTSSSHLNQGLPFLLPANNVPSIILRGIASTSILFTWPNYLILWAFINFISSSPFIYINKLTSGKSILNFCHHRHYHHCHYHSFKELDFVAHTGSLRGVRCYFSFWLYF